MAHGAIVALAGATYFYLIIIVEGQCAADDKDYLAVAFMGVKTARCTRTKRGIHYFHLVVNIVACVKMSIPTFEPSEMSFFNLFKIYNHSSVLNK